MSKPMIPCTKCGMLITVACPWCGETLPETVDVAEGLPDPVTLEGVFDTMLAHAPLPPKPPTLADAEKAWGRPEPWCCELACKEPAVWEITYGPSPDDVTHACTAHVGEMLEPGKFNSVYPVGAAAWQPPDKDAV